MLIDTPTTVDWCSVTTIIDTQSSSWLTLTHSVDWHSGNSLIDTQSPRWLTLSHLVDWHSVTTMIDTYSFRWFTLSQRFDWHSGLSLIDTQSLTFRWYQKKTREVLFAILYAFIPHLHRVAVESLVPVVPC